MDDAWTLSVERLCRQYFQQEPVLDLPSNDHLRLLEVQDSIFKNLFAAEDTLLHPPQRYKVKSLKRVMSRVEAAIMNCEQQVSRIAAQACCISLRNAQIQHA